MEAVMRHHLFVCTQEKPEWIPQCSSAGGKELLQNLRAAVVRAGRAEDIAVTPCGCLGLCRQGPIVIIHPEGLWLAGVAPADASRIVEALTAGDLEQLAPWRAGTPEELRTAIAAHRERVRQSEAATQQAGMVPEHIMNPIRGFQESRILLSAVELDLFTALGAGANAEEASRRLGTDERATAALLNALVAMGLLTKEDGIFRNTPETKTYLTAGGEHDSRLAIGHLANMWTRWSTLTDCVRRGTAVTNEEMAERGPEWTESFIAMMHKNAVLRADSVVGVLELTGVRRVLDLGGGSGGYAIALARAKEDIEATVFDLPTVTPLTRRYADATEVGGRLHTVDGDMRTDEYGEGYDLVLVSAICHMLSPEENVAVLRKVHRALAPGGRVVIQDFLLGEDKTQPKIAALFAINMLVATAAGNSYSVGEYREWLTEAGFKTVERLDLLAPTGLMVGRKE
jgi:(2Fe-2S) ferredoxin/SAM-dependent methyltransferase